MPGEIIRDEEGISVVVCTFNRLEMLKKCLESLQRQTYRNFEIIIVNDHSSDGTKQYLDASQSSNLIIVHHEKNLGLSPSRNDGVNQAKFGLIAFTDDDCVADENWLLEIKKAFDEHDADFGAGQTFLVSESYRGHFPERIVTNLNARWPKGNNLIIKKKIFGQIGLFDPAMDYYSNDDSEIAIRAVSRGVKFLSIPTAVVYHQKTYWTTTGLLRSARNPSVWVELKKRYPNHYLYFSPPIKFGLVINWEDYIFILTMPLVLPILLIRFIYHGQKDIKLFFVKWPIYPFLRRFYIYKASVSQRKFMI